MIRIAHFSDLHFSPKNLAESDRCFGFAVDDAIRQRVDVAVVTGDSTDHALDVHSPAIERLAHHVRRLADHCPVLMLQGTFSHEPPGTLSIFRLLGGRFQVHVADRIGQVALSEDGRWTSSPGWRFDALPARTRCLFTCVPTVNKAAVASVAGPANAATVLGDELSVLLAAFASIHQLARAAGVATVGLSHGTVSGCETEHGVPMAGFDHEFTTASLASAQAQAFLLGHIHRHQTWEQDGRVIGYAGSIGRFHHGEIGDKGFVIWEVGASQTRWRFTATPARRTVDLAFDGAPDLDAIRQAVVDQGLKDAHVRVRWTLPVEDRHLVDRAAIERALGDAASVQLEGRLLPVVRSRAAGISRTKSLADKVRAWASLTASAEGPLLECLEQLAHLEPDQIAEGVLAGPSASPAAEKPPCGSRDSGQPATAEASAQAVELELF